jgi:hypothetical protein
MLACHPVIGQNLHTPESSFHPSLSICVLPSHLLREAAG